VVKTLLKNWLRIGISISEGSIHKILLSEDISRREERATILLKRYEAGKKLNPKIIEELEKISSHFSIRNKLNQIIGEKVFIWRVGGTVTNFQKSIIFVICLDSCGSVASVYLWPYRLFTIRTGFYYYQNDDNEILSYYPFGESIYWIAEKIYKPLNRKLKNLYFPSTVGGLPAFLNGFWKPYCFNLYHVQHEQYFLNPIVKDFAKYFKNEFIKKRLKQIRYRYNNHPINEWPNLGLSPYKYAYRSNNQDIFLTEEFKHTKFNEHLEAEEMILNIIKTLRIMSPKCSGCEKNKVYPEFIRFIIHLKYVQITCQ